MALWLKIVLQFGLHQDSLLNLLYFSFFFLYLVSLLKHLFSVPALPSNSGPVFQVHLPDGDTDTHYNVVVSNITSFRVHTFRNI